MLTQEEIDEFFYQMSEELKKENIPILNNYILIFKNYPTKEELKNQQEDERKEIEELENEIITDEIN